MRNNEQKQADYRDVVHPYRPQFCRFDDVVWYDSERAAVRDVAHRCGKVADTRTVFRLGRAKHWIRRSTGSGDTRARSNNWYRHAGCHDGRNGLQRRLNLGRIRDVLLGGFCRCVRLAI